MVIVCPALAVAVDGKKLGFKDGKFIVNGFVRDSVFSFLDSSVLTLFALKLLKLGYLQYCASWELDSLN